MTVNDASASEGDGITFTVTLSEAVQGGLTVTPGFTDGTAVEGTDYDENTTALTFTAPRGDADLHGVDTTEDAVLEANETFTVSLTVSNAPTGTRDGHRHGHRHRQQRRLGRGDGERRERRRRQRHDLHGDALAKRCRAA